MPSDAPPSENLPAVRGRGRPKGAVHAEDRPKTYGGKPKFSFAEMRVALETNFGNAHMAADALNQAEKQAGGPRTISPRTIENFLESRGIENVVRMDGRKAAVDFAERRILGAIKSGDTKNSRWLLEQLGADRGYGKRADAEGLMLIDPQRLTNEQLAQILDPANLREDQLDFVLNFLSEKYLGGGPIIEHEQPLRDGTVPPEFANEAGE